MSKVTSNNNRYQLLRDIRPDKQDSYELAPHIPCQLPPFLVG